ncbi:MAG: T9SS type A sorting domain-containing protein [Candidatus Glassbacteria bacterium]|nr:T9SS type A sorting domain-containing protein [Candidatus Glassbacteria bacterium]
MARKLLVCCTALALLICPEVFAGDLFTNYSVPDGLVSNRIRSLAIDQAGNLWFGGKNNGAGRFDGSTLIEFTAANSGLSGAAIRDITLDSNGNVWFATSAGVSRFDGMDWVTYTSIDGLAGNNSFQIVEDAQGNMWIATQRGVSKYDGANWITYGEADGLGSQYVTSIFIDAEGNFWFGTKTAGVTRWDGFEWVIYDAENELGPTEVRAIAQDLQGNMWFGTRAKGVFKFDGISWTAYTTEDGLASNDVWGITVDQSGNMWFATYGGGLSMFDGSNWFSFSAEDGLADNSTNVIMLDDQGRLWIGSNDGLSMLSLKDALNEIFGKGELDAVAGRSNLPKFHSLSPSAPNPFNPSTEISYTVPEGGAVPVALKVFDSRGRLVRTLVKGIIEPGQYSVTWDGTDNSGRILSSGVYFYRMEASGFVMTRKMVLLK